jgi:hypothetical protein
VAEKHFQGFLDGETPQVARSRILPEFFRRADPLPVRQLKVSGINRINTINKDCRGARVFCGEENKERKMSTK